MLTLTLQAELLLVECGCSPDERQAFVSFLGEIAPSVYPQCGWWSDPESSLRKSP